MAPFFVLEVHTLKVVTIFIFVPTMPMLQSVLKTPLKEQFSTAV